MKNFLVPELENDHGQHFFFFVKFIEMSVEQTSRNKLAMKCLDKNHLIRNLPRSLRQKLQKNKKNEVKNVSKHSKNDISQIGNGNNDNADINDEDENINGDDE